MTLNLTKDIAVNFYHQYGMQIRFERIKTSTVIVMNSLYLYFLGLSLPNTSKSPINFKSEKRSRLYYWKVREIWFYGRLQT